MRKRRLWLIGSSLGVLAVIAVVTARWVQDAGSDERVTFGAVLPLTGPLSWLGESEQQGMLLAMKDVNSRGGVKGRKLEIRFEDSKGRPADGVAAVQKLLDVEQTKFIFTSLTGVSHSVSPVVTKRGGVQVVFAMDESIPINASNVFRIYPGIREEGEALLGYIASARPQRVALIYFKQAALEAEVRDVLEPGLQKLAVPVVAVDSFDRDDYTALRSIATKFRAVRPDVVFIGAYYNQMSAIVKALAESGLLRDAKVIAGVNFAVAVSLGSIPQEVLERVVVAVPAYSIYSQRAGNQSASALEFLAAYKKTYQKIPNFDVAYAYDAVGLLVEAVARVGTDPAKVKEQLRELGSYEGVTGKIVISQDGNARTSWQVGVYRDGALQVEAQAK